MRKLTSHMSFGRYQAVLLGPFGRYQDLVLAWELRQLLRIGMARNYETADKSLDDPGPKGLDSPGAAAFMPRVLSSHSFHDCGNPPIVANNLSSSMGLVCWGSMLGV